MDKRIPIVRRNGDVISWTTVDAEDYDWLNEHRWSLHSRGYAQTGGGSSKQLMHRMILGLTSRPGGGRGSGARVFQADHINGDKLDNRRVNLRIVTNQENHQNRRGANRGSSSTHRGVYWNKHSSKWMARVRTGGKDHYLGLFDDELEAARVAAEARSRLFPMCTD